MFHFFDFLVTLVQNLWNSIVGTIQFVIVLIEYVINGFRFVVSFVSFLPPFAIGFVTCLFALSVASLIIGNFIDM